MDAEDLNARLYVPPTRPEENSDEVSLSSAPRKGSLLDFIDEEERKMSMPSEATTTTTNATNTASVIRDTQATRRNRKDLTIVTSPSSTDVVMDVAKKEEEKEEEEDDDEVNSSAPPTRASLHAQHDLRRALAEAVIKERQRRGRDVFAPASVAHLGIDDPDLDVVRCFIIFFFVFR